MPEFLSPEWIAALDAAARCSPRLAACAKGDRFVIEDVIEMPDGTERAHHVVLAAGVARVFGGRDESADISLRTDLEVARGIALGTWNAQRALAIGRLVVSGDIETIAARAELLHAVEDVFAEVRADTTFPPPETATVTSAE